MQAKDRIRCLVRSRGLGDECRRQKVENEEPSSCFCIKKPKIKIALVIGIALSTILILVGAMFKIKSWPGGEYFLLLGLIGQVICITGLVIHMMTTEKTRIPFWNSTPTRFR